jgi:preprotein translocase subunit SecB
VNNPQPGAGNGQAAARQFGLIRLYVKDVSFEAPNTPEVFEVQVTSPDIKLNLRTSQRPLGDDHYEVVLHVSSHATTGDKSVFLVEVEQAGVFQVSGYNPDETRAILGVACPNRLLPYAREVISSLTQRGGFPPLYLQPIDFATLYAQQLQQQQAQGGQPMPPAGNA